MKRITLLLIMLFVSLALFSCKPSDTTPNTPTDEPNETAGNSVYGVGIETSLITNMDLDEKGVYDIIDSVSDKIYSYTDTGVFIYIDEKPQADHEIVVGETSRPISVKAKEKLEKRIGAEALKSVEYDNDEAAL